MKLLTMFLFGWLFCIMLREAEYLDYEVAWNKAVEQKIPMPMSNRMKWVEGERIIPWINYLNWRPDFYKCWDRFRDPDHWCTQFD